MSAIAWNAVRDQLGMGVRDQRNAHKRVFDVDMQHFPNCGSGKLKIIAAILERLVVEKI